MTRTSRSRAAMASILLAALLALVIPTAQGSTPERSLGRETARGSLLLVANPSPPCDDELTFAGRCKFLPHARLKVKSARSECKGRDVKIFRVDRGELVSTPNTTSSGVATTTLGGTYDAYFPGVPFNNPVYEVTGGTKMSFRAVAPQFGTYVGNNPLRPLVCKKLKSSIETVTAPMPQPPPPE